jgi:hypothetical protein
VWTVAAIGRADALVVVSVDHDVAVTTLSRMYPGEAGRQRPDQLLVIVGDPDEAAWLLARLDGTSG